MSQMETKDLLFKMTDVDERGFFTGYASVFGIVDSLGEMIKPGAFRNTLAEREGFALCWNHDIQEPVGLINAEEDSNGLRIAGRINTDVQRGKELRSLAIQGAVTGLLIGFATVRHEWRDKIRIIKELKLFEVSLCLWPANPAARISDVKARQVEPADIRDLLAFVDRQLGNLREFKDRLERLEYYKY